MHSKHARSSLHRHQREGLFHCPHQLGPQTFTLIDSLGLGILLENCLSIVIDVKLHRAAIT